MPACKTCGNHFSARVVIDNKQRILTNRKRCFDCVPFVSREEKAENIVDGQTRLCSCGKTFSREKTTGIKCSTCLNKITRLRRKTELVAYKGGKCIKCGYNKCLRALSFHHMDDTTKEFTISQLSVSMERMKKEADKCVLLCSNCHMELEDGLWQLEEKMPNAM